MTVHPAQTQTSSTGANVSEQEEVHVADAAPALPGNHYSEAQHFSLVKSAVEQETAKVAAEKAELEAKVETLESEKAATATKLSEAENRIDLLEADKATAEQAAEAAKTELADFKALLEKKKEIEEKKKSRKSKVEAANAALAEDFFTEERITRWAEMSDEAFEALVEDMTEMAKAHAAAPASTSETKTTTEAARETAAFTGGTTPTASEGTSSLRQLFGLTAGIPVA
jgi:chromosome segregation ATPase